jgi:LmbE family N-acetylglucosaminyl deacetylase
LIGLALPSDRPLRILALGAHADDIEIGAGGLLLDLLAADRVEAIDWVVLSAEGPRADEARRSAEGLVAGRATLRTEVEAFRERFFPHLPEIKDFVDGLGKRVRPDLVLAPRLEDRHQDHRTVAELTWQAFRDHLVLEYEIVKYEGDLGAPNLYAPLADTVVTAKIEHLMTAFPSQFHHPWYDESGFRALMRIRGIESNAPSGYAEAFTGRKVVLSA